MVTVQGSGTCRAGERPSPGAVEALPRGQEINYWARPPGGPI